jgi:tetratricopeptide (TPR) repeat protein
MRHALDLDPLSLIIQTHLGWVFYTLGEYDLAIKQLRQALELDRNFLFAQWMLGQTHSVAGQHREAIRLIEKVNALFGRDPPVLAGLLGYNLAKAGREAQARELLGCLEESVKAGTASPYEIVLLCTGLGEVDKAFAWLEVCYADRSSYLGLLKIERILDPLRSDLRFQDLVFRINFPS